MKRIAIVALVSALLWTGADYDGTAAQSRARASAPPATTRGKTVYDDHCADCHGSGGKGDGPASPLLTPRPRDFTSAKFKIRSTETGTLPTDEDLTQSIRHGLYGTSMPGWDGVLSGGDIDEVTAYIKTFSPRFASEQPRPIEPFPGDASSASVDVGRQVYARLQCGKCHGDDGRGTGAIAATFEDDWAQPLAAANLTEPWTFRGGPGAADVYMRLRAGMSGTPMPSFQGAASERELWQLANYVVSLGRKPVWQMTSSEVAEFYSREQDEARRNPVARGKYLVDTLSCAMCHSPLDDQKRVIPGLQMAGGLRIRVEPFGDYPSGNLTSDKETGLGNWTDEEIARAFTRGILRDGTRLLPYPMDWASYSTMSDDELHAIVAYLRTIPPIRNRVPRPTRTFLPLYLWGKFRMLVLGNDPPMIFYPGNAGTVS